MSPLLTGLSVLFALLVLLGIGTPIAFALGLVSVLALLVVDGAGSLSILGETFSVVLRPSALSRSRCSS